jgi:hypothetical protein
VTVLGALMFVVALSVLLDCARAIARNPGEVFTPASIVVIALRWVLPAAWVGATGVGLLRGRSWARGCFFALAALSLVAAAGAISRPMDSAEAKLLAGAYVSVFVVMAAGTWYLLLEKVRNWFA